MVAVWFLRVSIWAIRAMWILLLAMTLIELGFLAFHFTFHGSDAAHKWVINTYGGPRIEGDVIYQPSPEQVRREFISALVWQLLGIVGGLFLFPFLKKTHRRWVDEISPDYLSTVLSVSPHRLRNQGTPGVSSKNT